LPVGAVLGIRGCQELSGDLTDLSGGGITLTASGSVVYQQTATGTVRKAVGFDGPAERFAAALDSTYDLDASTSATFMIAFSCPNLPVSDRPLFGKRAPVAPLEGYYGRIETTGRIRFVVDDGPDGTSLAVLVDHADGAMHGMVCVIDRGTDELRLYTDLGTATLSLGGTIGTLTNTQTYGLGTVSGSVSSGDNVRIHYEAITLGVAWTQVDFDAWWARRN
jgi:hypothetical protein